MRKKIFNYIVLSFIVILFPLSAMAASFQAGERMLVSIPSSDDLYVAGGQIRVESKIDGDLLVAGGEIDIDSEISGDLFAAGGRIYVDKNVGDDVRVVGGQIEIRGNVGDDVIVFGGQIRILDNVEIGGDLIVNGGEIRLDGKVLGNIIVNGGRVVLNGSVAQNAQINSKLFEMNGNIGSSSKLVAEEIMLGANTSFGESVEYWTKKGEIDFGSANATYNSSLGERFEKAKRGGVGFENAMKALFFFSGILIIALLLIARKLFNGVSKTLKEERLKSFGIGVLYFILLPVVGVLLCITFIGLPLGLFTLMIYGFSFVFAIPTSAVVMATCWERKKEKKWGNWKFFGASILIFLILKIVVLIPVLGCLLVGFIVASVFGAVITEKMKIAKEILK